MWSRRRTVRPPAAVPLNRPPTLSRERRTALLQYYGAAILLTYDGYNLVVVLYPVDLLL